MLDAQRLVGATSCYKEGIANCELAGGGPSAFRHANLGPVDVRILPRELP